MNSETQFWNEVKAEIAEAIRTTPEYSDVMAQKFGVSRSFVSETATEIGITLPRRKSGCKEGRYANRDKRIRQLKQDGKSNRELADLFELSEQRVSDIIHNRKRTGIRKCQTS